MIIHLIMSDDIIDINEIILSKKINLYLPS